MADGVEILKNILQNNPEEFNKLPEQTRWAVLESMGIERPRSLTEKAVDFVTGRREKEFDYPDFDAGYLHPEYKGATESMLTVPPMKISDDRSAFYNAAATDEARQEIIKNYRPDIASTLKKDKFGVPYLTLGDKSYYLNQPGASAQDLRNLGNMAAAARGPAKLLKKPLTAGSVALRTSAAGLAGAGTSVTQDVLAGQGGATEGVSGERAALNAGLSSATMLAWPLIKALGIKPFQAVFGRPSLVKGEFSTEAIEAFRKAGIDPKVFTAEEKVRIAKMLEEATDPSSLLAAEEALSLEYPVGLTKGQATGDRAQQALEYQMRSGLLGPTAQERIGSFDTQARSNTARNIQSVRERVVGDTPFNEYNIGVGQAQLQLGQDRIAAKAKYSQLYKDIEEFSDDALAWVETPERFRQALLNDPLITENMKYSKRLSDIVDDFETNVMRLDKGPAGAGGTTGSHAPKVNELFEWRKRLNAKIDGAPPEEMRLLLPVKRKFDQFMKDTVADGLVRGDPKLIEMWQKAIKSRAEYGKLFDSDDIVNHITVLTKDGAELAVDPHAAANMIFGASDAGFITKWAALRDFTLLKDRLNKKSWDALRGDVMLRMFGMTREELEAVAAGSAQLPSGQRFKTNLDTFRTKNAGLYKLMFDDQEHALINKVADVWKRVTVPAQGAANPSGSGLWVGQMGQRLVGGTVGSMLREMLALASPMTRMVIKPIKGSVKANIATGHGAGYVPPTKMLVPPSPMVSPTAGGAEQRLLDRYDNAP